MDKRKPPQDNKNNRESLSDFHKAIRDFYRRALMLQEEEKKRISRDLHDETGQIVISLGTGLNIIEKAIKEGHLEKAFELINENRKMIQGITSRMKAMALNLRPPALDILGLSATLREYFSQYTKSSSIKVVFNENLKDTKINSDIEITLYRIVQEAMNNIFKHSGATSVIVGLMLEDKKITLRIEDNGKGFDVNEFEREYDANRMGLRGVRERVDLLNGVFSIESISGKGTKLTVVFNLEE